MLLGNRSEMETSLSNKMLRQPVKKMFKLVWKEIKTIRQTKTNILAETLEGLNNPLSIVNMFVEKYETLYNSVYIKRNLIVGMNDKIK